jgi:hypothetical protein
MLLAALLTLQLAAPADVSALVARARAARYQQDSALASYTTVVRQRISASIGVKRGLVGQIGRPRLAARTESVARVGWDHAQGAWGEIIAARSVAPIVGENDAMDEVDDVALVLPYYPGRDRLWPVDEMREAFREGDFDEEWIAHPLDRGADSLYAFSFGDSLTFKLPDGAVVRLRELRVRPRRPDSRLVVGSLWVDVVSGALVRAAYRPSMAMDLWPFFGEELDDDVKEKVRKLGPFLGTMREVIVENGLYQGRFWLPRTRIANAEGTAQIGRVTASIEQTFTYEKVRALEPGVVFGHREPTPDIDPRDGRVRRGQWRGVANRSRACRLPDDTTSFDSLVFDKDLSIMYSEGVRMRVMMPCRRRDLVNSPELPKSIYDPSEELFTQTDFNALRKDVEGALSIGAQAELSPLPATIHYGIDKGLLRYNRIEGLSAGAGVERVLGSGYTVNASARIGHADLEPNAEFSIKRTNSRRDVQLTAYRRLAPANDWGDPLSLGASINALLFARDDGFYYRGMGGELTGTLAGSIEKLPVTWRLFAERQDSARVETQESFSRLVSGTRFLPNIQARAGTYFGASTAIGFSWGLDPEGTRSWGALRLEGAGGESSYGRAMLDASFARGLGKRRVVTITGGAGTSAGELPIQRNWLVGGPYTVRGHRPGTMAGDSFWLGRIELAQGHPMVRPVLFGDIGWAGSREMWSDIGRPLSGAGVGAAFLDGIVRFDVARGIGVDGRWRIDAYFEIR